jgi:hypothetical protein
VRTITLSRKSRIFSSSHTAGSWRERSCSWTLFLLLEEAVGKFRIACQSTVTARFFVIEHQVEQIPARFPLLEQHQTGHAKPQDHEHQEPIHWQEEHVPVREEELPDQHGDCARHRKKQHVLELKTEQSDLGVQIARYPDSFSVPLHHPACTGCDEVFHQPHQPRNREACTAGDEMSNPVVTDIKSLEKEVRRAINSIHDKLVATGTEGPAPQQPVATSAETPESEVDTGAFVQEQSSTIERRSAKEGKRKSKYRLAVSFCNLRAKGLGANPLNS